MGVAAAACFDPVTGADHSTSTALIVSSCCCGTQVGMGPRSSALVGGYTAMHRDLETALADLKGEQFGVCKAPFDSCAVLLRCIHCASQLPAQQQARLMLARRNAEHNRFRTAAIRRPLLYCTGTAAGTEECLLFPTGFAANTAAMAALAADPDAVIFSDELNHASIIDGARRATTFLLPTTS